MASNFPVCVWTLYSPSTASPPDVPAGWFPFSWDAREPICVTRFDRDRRQGYLGGPRSSRTAASQGLSASLRSTTN